MIERVVIGGERKTVFPVQLVFDNKTIVNRVIGNKNEFSLTIFEALRRNIDVSTQRSEKSSLNNPISVLNKVFNESQRTDIKNLIIRRENSETFEIFLQQS